MDGLCKTKMSDVRPERRIRLFSSCLNQAEKQNRSTGLLNFFDPHSPVVYVVPSQRFPPASPPRFRVRVARTHTPATPKTHDKPRVTRQEVTASPAVTLPLPLGSPRFTAGDMWRPPETGRPGRSFDTWVMLNSLYAS